MKKEIINLLDEDEEEDEEEELFSSPETKKKIEIENRIYSEKIKNLKGNSPSKMKTKKIHIEVSKMIHKKLEKDDTIPKRKLKLISKTEEEEKDEESEREYIFSNEKNSNENYGSSSSEGTQYTKKFKNDLKDFIVPNDIEISQESWTSSINSTPSTVTSSLEFKSPSTSTISIQRNSNKYLHNNNGLSSFNKVNTKPQINTLSNFSLIFDKEEDEIEKKEIKEKEEEEKEEKYIMIKNKIKLQSNIKFNQYCKYLKKCIKNEKEINIEEFEIENDFKKLKNKILKDDKREIIELFVKIYSKLEIEIIKEEDEIEDIKKCEVCKIENIKFNLKLFDDCYNSDKLWNETKFEKYKIKNENKFKIGFNCSKNLKLFHDLFHFKFNTMIKIKNKKSFQNIFKEDYKELIQKINDEYLIDLY